MRRILPLAALCSAAVAAGCSDTLASSTDPHLSPASAANDRGRPQTKDERFVVIGTSISMGWASNGVYDATQRVAWPALLAFDNQRGLSLPLIQSPGCTSPIVPPLGAGVRLSGESIAGSTVCAPNDAGVVLPANNVALASALAIDVLQTTPEASPLPWFARVLPPQTTPLMAALAQNPTMLAVELGGNEVLNATSGLAVPGVTMVPLPFFFGPYDALLDGAAQTHTKAILLGLPTEARNLPALRRGDEIWADRAEFAALHVDVSNDCDGNRNYINVSIKSLNLVFTGAFTFAHGFPNPVYSCADVPGAQDLVLTPADIALVNGFLAQMSDHIKQQAKARGFAYASLGALYDLPGLKGGPYSVIAQLTSTRPYGPFISLDGVHPSVLGHAVLALAAAVEINRTYGGGAHTINNAVGVSLADAMVEPVAPGVALSNARRVALAHAGETLSPCLTGGCDVARRRGLR